MRLDRWVPRRRPKREPLIRPEDILLSKRITWRIDEPFTIFECKDFFTADVYRALSDDFPMKELEAKVHATGSRQARLHRDGSSDLDGFLDRSYVWRSFHDALMSRQFVSDVFDVMGREIRKAFRARPGLRRLQPLHAQVLKYRHFSRLDFDINCSLRGYELTPHVDKASKLVALLFYFPVASEHEGRDGGTGFWRRRPGSTELPTKLTQKGQLPRVVEPNDDAAEADIAKRTFQTSFERFHVAEYRANCVSGFVKTQDSWHDVDLRDFPEGARRRVVLYNINLR
ncbi:MAG: hypothetical protein ACKORC_00845 [Acidimicrobiia bacterium]